MSGESFPQMSTAENRNRSERVRTEVWEVRQGTEEPVYLSSERDAVRREE